MFSVKNGNITMIEGEYGLELPITITGTDIAYDEQIKFVVKDSSGEIKIEKAYANIADNVINFSLTQMESNLLVANKKYTYSIDWYKNGEFLGNIINGHDFNVEEKK